MRVFSYLWLDQPVCQPALRLSLRQQHQKLWAHLCTPLFPRVPQTRGGDLCHHLKQLLLAPKNLAWFSSSRVVPQPSHHQIPGDNGTFKLRPSRPNFIEEHSHPHRRRGLNNRLWNIPIPSSSALARTNCMIFQPQTEEIANMIALSKTASTSAKSLKFWPVTLITFTFLLKA